MKGVVVDGIVYIPIEDWILWCENENRLYGDTRYNSTIKDLLRIKSRFLQIELTKESG